MENAKGYKAFAPGMICRGKQYAENTDYAGFVKACIDYTKEQTIDNMPKSEIGTGDSAQIGSSGDSAKIGSSGYSAKIGSSGYSAKINSTGEDSVICCAGSGSVVKARAGSWITLAEWEYSDEKGRFAPCCVKTEYVDGEKIKADTWYCLKNGEFVEVE